MAFSTATANVTHNSQGHSWIANCMYPTAVYDNKTVLLLDDQ